MRTIEERFWSKVDVRGAEECWEWQAGRTKRGYGQFILDGRRRSAHQVAWELSREAAFPTGMYGCHVCDNPPCVNPAHIVAATQRENILDCVRKRRHGLATTPPDRVRAAVNEYLSTDLSQAKVAAKYGVSRSAFRNWLHARYRAPDAGLTPQVAKRAALRPCGTRAAYVRHRSRGEQPCSECIAAIAAYDRDRRKGRAA